jgi:hypothetical protein
LQHAARRQFGQQLAIAKGSLAGGCSEQGGTTMDCETTLGMELDTAPETRLWQAVILSVVGDWVSGGLRAKREAEAYLFEDQTDFRRVCESAGMDADRLRSRLKRLRDRQSRN